MTRRKAAPTVDVGKVTMPVIKIIGGLCGLIFGVVSLTLAYNSIINRMDRQEIAQAALIEGLKTTNEAIGKLAASVQTLAERAATTEEVNDKIESSKLQTCMQYEIANQRTFKCPFLGAGASANASLPKRTASKSKPPEPGLFGLFGAN